MATAIGAMTYAEEDTSLWSWLTTVDHKRIGAVYTGKVVAIKEFGCFVELAPGTDGMVHVSELAHGFVKKVDEQVKVGDVVTVKVINIDDNGRIKLSRKAMLPAPEATARV